ncbi:hypothetical protein N7466_009592 [Penicillium verhagenii]|uniref:uncharacterized protein n=1 Tax=Penicillium verhagenii TaxID=1562060 RepID=UPI0025450731|nr:uncharacterized protein N7466_009592 [Penicillium verhagenii]KAJ5921266.1 hypothetical protein N7466_009592 [Penicillium verhagenii]
MASKYAIQWKNAMEEQLQKLHDADAWSEVLKIQAHRTKVLPGRWVFDLKSNNEGHVTQFRARWVVCGNRQVKAAHRLQAT